MPLICWWYEECVNSSQAATSFIITAIYALHFRFPHTAPLWILLYTQPTIPGSTRSTSWSTANLTWYNRRSEVTAECLNNPRCTRLGLWIRIIIFRFCDCKRRLHLELTTGKPFRIPQLWQEHRFLSRKGLTTRNVLFWLIFSQVRHHWTAHCLRCGRNSVQTFPVLRGVFTIRVSPKSDYSFIMRRPGRDNTASMDEANKTAPAAAKKRKTR